MAQITVPQGGGTITRRTDGVQFFLSAGSKYSSNTYTFEPGKSTPQSTSKTTTSVRTQVPTTTQQPTTQPPNTNLQPGTRSNEVKQLQDYLVSQGYMTQAQMNTGPGIYGPKTKAAVTRLQEDLGVDNTTGPGFYGPRTRKAVQEAVQPPDTEIATEDEAITEPEDIPEDEPEFDPGVTPDDTDTTSDFINELIKNNPFIQDQLKDPALRELFDNLPPELKPAYVQLLNQLGKSIEAGKVINPDIEITPQKLQEFMDQAVTELDPFYQEQIGLVKTDLKTSLGRIQEDFDRSVERAEEPFLEGLSAQDEAEAQAGTTFGSERARREGQIIGGQQDLIDDALRGSSRRIEDISSQAERTIGSSNLSSILSPSLRGTTVSRAGFTPGERSLSFTPQGNLLGTLPKKREVDIRTRASELEDTERRQRILDLSKLR